MYTEKDDTYQKDGLAALNVLNLLLAEGELEWVLSSALFYEVQIYKRTEGPFDLFARAVRAWYDSVGDSKGPQIIAYFESLSMLTDTDALANPVKTFTEVLNLPFTFDPKLNRNYFDITKPNRILTSKQTRIIIFALKQMRDVLFRGISDETFLKAMRSTPAANKDERQKRDLYQALSRSIRDLKGLLDHNDIDQVVEQIQDNALIYDGKRLGFFECIDSYAAATVKGKPFARIMARSARCLKFAGINKDTFENDLRVEAKEYSRAGITTQIRFLIQVLKGCQSTIRQSMHIL